MACQVCGRVAQAGSCEDGYVPYLSGDYPCPFNPDAEWLEVRNPKAVAPIVIKRLTVVEPPAESADGLEDLL